MSWDFDAVLERSKAWVDSMREIGCEARATVTDEDGTVRFTMQTPGFQEKS